ncbi:MAG: HAD-IIB family hydrolase [Candidatus Levyibacteriota bacterium]
MIKAIVTDVDGVLTGNKSGFNFPKPSFDVISALTTIHKKGIPVILCTAKIASAIEDIIGDAQLSNPHIADGGALVFDPLEHKIIKEHILENALAQKMIQVCVAHNIHISAHTVNNLFIDKTHNKYITEKRRLIVKRDLSVVDSLENRIKTEQIIKLTLTVVDKKEKALAEKLLAPFKDQIHFIWSHHPMSHPWEYGIISSKGVSKVSAMREVLKILNLEASEVLGVGDGFADWVFMEHCGYAGVVGDKSPELKDLVKTKGIGKYFLAPSVDENGLLDILKYFKLL